MSVSNRARQRLVWAFVLALSGVGILCALAAAHLDAPLVTPDVAIPFVAVVLAVAASEFCMFEIRYRTDSHVLTLAELVLVLGIVYYRPGPFLVAQVLGLSIPFLWRRATPVRAVFNLANATLGASGAFALTHLMLGSAQPHEPRFWAIVLLGVIVSAPLTSLLVTTVRSIAEGRMLVREAPRLAFFTTVNAVAVASVGVLIGLVNRTMPELALLALVPAALSYSAFRLYLHEQRSRSNVEFLYEATKTLHRSTEIDDAFKELLEATRTVFRAEAAQLAIARPDTGAWLRFSVGGSARPASTVKPAWIPGTDDPRMITLAGSDSERALLAEIGATNALVRRLRGEAGMLGLLIVANRIGGVQAFGSTETYLFDLLANQVAVGLENSHLERSLSQLTELEEELRHQANHDALTGLANRALLSSALHDGAATRRAVLLIDLDDFKTINDSLGHAAGDAVLIEVGRRLRGCVRDEDIVARLGGDEFAVLLEPGANSDAIASATETAARVADALMPPMHIGNSDLVVRGSVGVAYAAPGDALGDVLRNADVAMYEAKRSGKGTHRVFESSMVKAAHERLHVMNGLRRAIDRDEFSLRYQPIVELSTRSCVAVEALLRWENPVLGVVLPDRFVPVAEESGLIVEIGRWILRQACEDVVALRSGDGTPLGLSVNVAARQLLDPNFVALLEDVTRRVGFEPERLVLEITETTALADSQVVTEAAQRVRSLGIRLALDDFGTGYSSLAVVHGFPLDLVKIDKMFIRSDDHSLARAIVTLADSLGLGSVAEGVETEEQARSVEAMGCGLAQGYAFARPSKIEDLPNLVGRRLGPIAVATRV